MSDTSEEIRVQVPLSAATVAKVDELAELMNVGRGRMAAMLLEVGIEDNDWIIRAMTSGYMKPVRAMIERWSGKKTRAKGATA